MTAGLTQRRRDALAPQHARVRVLAVGIDDYDRGCGFDPLTTCRNDAVGLADCFRETPQLGADPHAISLLASRSTPAPSRGEIIKALRDLVRSTTADDRLIFFFSGRSHRLAGDPEVYLVPQDAFADDDPTCLIALSQISSLLAGAPARQKSMLLDVRAAFPRELLDDALRAAPGLTAIASAPAGPRSTTRSPNPQHSPLTAHLLTALRGQAPQALDGRRLTIPSLYQYLASQLPRGARPLLHESSDSPLELADFGGPLLTPDPVGLDGRLFGRFELSSRARSVALKDILTGLTRTTYSPAYLERRANEALGEYLGHRFGPLVSRLRARFKWSSSAVVAEGNGITFPDGQYEVRYEATGKLQGVLVEQLALEPVWLDAPGAVADLLDCLDVDPTRVTFALRNDLSLRGCVARLEAGGWQLTSELPSRLEASRGGCTLILQKDSMTLVELPLRALFAETPDEAAVRTAAAALAVFAGS